MTSAIGSLNGLINALLPFTRPGTPILQDIVHTAAICALLYFLPLIADLQQRSRGSAGRLAHVPHPADQRHEIDNDRPGDDDAQEPTDETIVPGDLATEGEEPHVDGGADGIEQADAPPAVPEALQQQQLRRPRDTANVGAKKAKSLARREQRRAYHEFVRSQADQQRAAEASTAVARETALAAEKERRAEAERRYDEQRAKEQRSTKAIREEKERLERERRILCERIVKERVGEEGAVDLMEVAEELFIDDVFSMKLPDAEADKVWQEKLIWVERLVRAIPGLLGRREVDGEMVITLMTASRWIVRVDRDVMDMAYKRAESLAKYGLRSGRDGRIELKEFGHVLEDALLVGVAG